MAKDVHDILIDEDGEDITENGDFKIGESTNQHTEEILISSPGEWKRTPALGFNIRRFINAPASERNRFERELQVQLELDGQEVNDIDLSGGFENIVIDSNYE